MENEEVDGLTFEQWIAKVDELFLAKFYISYLDFPDWNYYDNWADGVTPEECFADYVEEQGYED